MSTNDALETLTDLPGIGPWSAGLVLLRGLGRLDVFPSGDVGAERGLRTLLRAGARTSLKRIVERFGDRRGYLYFCALGGSLFGEGSDPPGSLTPRTTAGSEPPSRGDAVRKPFRDIDTRGRIAMLAIG